jgi:hypothetical protein
MQFVLALDSKLVRRSDNFCRRRLRVTRESDSIAHGRGYGVLRGGSRATSNRLEMQSSYRNVVGRNERDVIYGFRSVLATTPGGDAKDH